MRRDQADPHLLCSGTISRSVPNQYSLHEGLQRERRDPWLRVTGGQHREQRG